MKQYQKPEVIYENFVLAEHIAQCDYKLGLGEHDCQIVLDRYTDDGWDFNTGFIDSVHCDIIVSNYCYTNGTEAGMPKIFQS